MSSGNSSSSSGGIGFFGLLAIVFIALKLTGYIDWSWWWILAPLWGGFAFVMALIIVVAAIALWSESSTERAMRRYRDRLKK